MNHKTKFVSFISWNALNFGFLVIISLVSIPFYYNKLSPESFAAVSLIWSILAIGTSLDLGVGRVLTRELSAMTNEFKKQNYRTTASSGLVATALNSTLAALIIFFGAYLYFNAVGQRFDVKLHEIMLIGIAAFLTLASNGVLAILDGMHFIRLASMIRMISSLCFMGGPVVYLVIHDAPTLSGIVPILTLTRFFQLITGLLILFNEDLLSFSSTSFLKIKGFFTMGKWLTLSNIVGIAMSNIDRFILGYFHDLVALANYVLASDLIKKGVGFQSVISASIFPLISRSSPSLSNKKYLKVAIKLNILICALGILFGIFLIDRFLKIWLHSDDVENIATLFQIMLVGWVASGFGQLYLADVHAAGFMKLPAIIHSVEAVIAIPIMIYLLYRYGVHGAAFAWVGRCVIDTLILKLISNKIK